MTHTQHSFDPTHSSVSPSSTKTNDSTFADSAIDVGSRTPTQPEDMPVHNQPLPSADRRTSELLTQLAAAAWATEQELTPNGAQRRKIQKALKLIEECIDEPEDSATEEAEETEETRNPPVSWRPDELSGDDEAIPDPQQLVEIHDNLRATVKSMRLRQQEQRHLHQISVEKLESVAQTCLVQETQLKDMAEEIRNLRMENRKLGEENDGLHDQLADLQSQATQKEVAVNAMSSAVKGLEGWINSSPGPYGGTPSRPRLNRNNNYIVRGKGRFRARYYLDDQENGSADLGLDGTSDSRELYDGVRGWLRGFRDVEEELQKVASDKPGTSENSKMDLGSMDDWGDFETIPEVR